MHEFEKSSFCHPEPLFFCHPEASAEGSLGACAPREDIPGRRPERSEEGRRPERSEGCLAIARKDRMVGFTLKALSEGLDYKFFCSQEAARYSQIAGILFP